LKDGSLYSVDDYIEIGKFGAPGSVTTYNVEAVEAVEAVPPGCEI
jgi:hypothetical protein